MIASKFVIFCFRLFNFSLYFSFLFLLSLSLSFFVLRSWFLAFVPAMKVSFPKKKTKTNKESLLGNFDINLFILS